MFLLIDVIVNEKLFGFMYKKLKIKKKIDNVFM